MKSKVKIVEVSKHTKIRVTHLLKNGVVHLIVNVINL